MRTYELDARLLFCGKTRSDLAEAISARMGKAVSNGYIAVAFNEQDVNHSRREIVTAADLITRRWVAERKREIEDELSERYGFEVEVVPPIAGNVAIIRNGEYVGTYSLEQKKLVQ